ncbi:MAG: hypothetical protein LBU17_07835 [Treponema sp.]|jgi:hypothetical protein|nr:hypothetical protein [Treponema sp.]
MKKDQLVGSGAFRAALLLRTAAALAIVLGISALMFTGCKTDDEEEEEVFNPPVTWTQVSSTAFGTTTVQKVAFGNNTFVATGNGATAWYSTDGINWTASSSTSGFVTGNNISGLGFGGEMFVATGGSSSNTTRAYSRDGGKTWIASGTNGFNAKSVAYNNGTFLVGGSGGRITYTTDPSNVAWTVLEADTTTFNATGKNGFINAITYGNGKFVAGGSNYGHTAYSSDGRTWQSNTQTEAIFGGNWINGLAYGGGKFVVAGEGSGILAWSSDGINWTTVVNTGVIGQNFMNIAYGNGSFVAVTAGGGASYSSDGITWTPITNTTFGGGSINGVVFGNDKWIIVGADGKAAYSVVR